MPMNVIHEESQSYTGQKQIILPILSMATIVHIKIIKDQFQLVLPGAGLPQLSGPCQGQGLHSVLLEVLAPPRAGPWILCEKG